MGEISGENKGAFKCVKISLIVLYVLSIIVFICLIAISIFGLKVLGSDDVHPEHQIKPEDKENTKLLFTIAITISVLSLLFLIIGLIGVIKENKYIVIAITVFGIIGIIFNLAKGDIISAIIGSFSTLLAGIYAYMIVQKEQNNHYV